jgi:hypothetical protein
MAGAAAAVLVLLTLFHSLPEKFLFPRRIAQQQAAVIEQRSDAIEPDLTSAREAAGSVQRELSRECLNLWKLAGQAISSPAANRLP